jgi:hypothetical protein
MFHNFKKINRLKLNFFLFSDHLDVLILKIIF